jgi:hypothetical protein
MGVVIALLVQVEVGVEMDLLVQLAHKAILEDQLVKEV